MHTFHITAPNGELREALQQKIDSLNKPKGAMGRLEDLALQIGLIQGALSPTLAHPCHLLFGADHGIATENVSASPQEVTWQQMINFTHGGGGVNMFCRQHHIELFLIDVGVAHDLSSYPTILSRKIACGTKNFLHGLAMTAEQCEQALQTGADMVDICAQKGCNILSIGEMGIANTSAASLWMSIFTKIPLSDCIGAGSGLNEAGIAHKNKILMEALHHFYTQHLPATAALAYFGGFEMVAAVGAMLRAAEQKMVILIDGFIMTACLLAATHIHKNVRHYAIFTHCSEEKGHRLLLQHLRAHPLLSLGLRLGEGTGALCCYPIVESAVRMLNEMNNFDNAHITKYF